MDVGKPITPVRAEPTQVVERLWQDYLRYELRGTVTDGEMLKKLRHSFYTGVWAQSTLTKKAMSLPDRAAVNLINGISAEVESVVRPKIISPCLPEGNLN